MGKDLLRLFLRMGRPALGPQERNRQAIGQQSTSWPGVGPVWALLGRRAESTAQKVRWHRVPTCHRQLSGELSSLAPGGAGRQAEVPAAPP